MAITNETIATFIAAQKASKTPLKAVAAEIAPAPVTAEEYDLVKTAFGTAGIPAVLNRALRLGGARIAQLDAIAANLHATRPIKSTVGALAGFLADAEIETARVTGATDAQHAESVQNAAMKKATVWEASYSAARAEVDDLIERLKKALPKCEFEPDQLKAARAGVDMTAAAV